MTDWTVSGLTGGVEFHLASTVEWAGRELQTVLSGAPQEALTFGRVRLGIEASTSAFATDGMLRFSRDVFGDGKGTAVVRNAATSGFDLRVEVADTETRIAARWRPARQEQILSKVMKARQRLLLAQALIHYPALWQAS